MGTADPYPDGILPLPKHKPSRLGALSLDPGGEQALEGSERPGEPGESARDTGIRTAQDRAQTGPVFVLSRALQGLGAWSLNAREEAGEARLELDMGTQNRSKYVQNKQFNAGSEQGVKV